MRFALTIPVMLLAIGCGGREGEILPEPPGETGLLLVGGNQEGTSGFLELDDGSDVTLVPGAQGGFHVFVNVRIEESEMDSTSGSVILDRKARRETTDQLVSQAKHRATLVASPEAGFLETEKAIPMFLCPTPIGISVADEVLVIRVRALADEASAEATAEGTIRIRPRCPSGEQETFCRRICSG